MKIFWSDAFDDYFFEFGIGLHLLIFDKSLDPDSVLWDHYKFTKPTDLKLITEVEA